MVPIVTLLLVAIISSDAVAQGSIRKVQWQHQPDSRVYWGNVWLEGHISRFKTKSLTIFVDQNAIVEVYASVPKGDRQLVVSRPIKKKAAQKSIVNKSKGTPKEIDLSNPEVTVKDPLVTKAYGLDSQDPFFEPVVKKGGSRPKVLVESKPNGEILFGLLMAQDQLVSEGLLGKFDGKGVTSGLHLGFDMFPRTREYSPIFLNIAGEFGSFETEISESVDGSDPKTTTKKLSVMSLRVTSFWPISWTEGHEMSVGVGGGYEKLPFFERVVEAEGSGSLDSKTSIGFIFAFRYLKRSILSGDLTLDVGLIPIGANTKSVQQVDLAVKWQKNISPELALFLAGMHKQQTLVFPQECSENDEEQCATPKTSSQKSGAIFGMTMFY